MMATRIGRPDAMNAQRALPREESPAAHALRVLATHAVAVYPVFVELTGNLNSALMLAQTLYWTRKYLLDHPERQGWLRKSRLEWSRETGLTRTEQETARHHLRGYDFWQEAHRGMPATLHCRIDLQRLAMRINREVDANTIDWRNSAALRLFLGRPLLLRRRLTEWTHSTNATWLLSYFMQRAGMLLASGIEQPQFNVSMSALMSDTRLSRKELETARHELCALGFVKENRRKRPPPHNRIEYRLNFEHLSRLLDEDAPVASMAQAAPRTLYGDRRIPARQNTPSQVSGTNHILRGNAGAIPGGDAPAIRPNPANWVSTGSGPGKMAIRTGNSMPSTVTKAPIGDLFSQLHTSDKQGFEWD